MRSFVRKALPLLLLPAMAWSAAPRCPGQPELPTDSVLAELIQQSLAERPELAQARATAAAERQRIKQAGALPDPMLQLGVQNDGFTSWEIGKMETSWYSVMATQAFPWPGTLGLRSEVAQLAADQADQSVVRLRLSTEAEVRRAYLDLMLARDRLALVDQLDALARRAATVAQARYEAGMGTLADALRARLEVRRVLLRYLPLQVDVSRALQTLNRLRGRPLSEPIEPKYHVASWDLPKLRPDDLDYAFACSPELASARAGAQQGQRSTALARKAYVPELTVNLGVMPRGGDFPPMWLASVGLPIPIFAGSKQDRAIAESESRLKASQSGTAAVEQTLRLRVEERRTALIATLDMIGLYRGGILAESQAAAESTLAQYEVGKVTLIAVLEAVGGFIADQESFLQLLAQAHRLEIDAAEVSLAPVGALGAGMAPAGIGANGEGMQPGVAAPAMPAPAPTGGDTSSGKGGM